MDKGLLNLAIYCYIKKNNPESVSGEPGLDNSFFKSQNPKGSLNHADTAHMYLLDCYSRQT